MFEQAAFVANPMVVLDLANNHNGSISHGYEIITRLKQEIGVTRPNVAIKFQYRNLNTFIHPNYRGRQDIKYIKRFEETELSFEDLADLSRFARQQGFLTAATPFDEASVWYVADHNHDFLKVASASLVDWPLWEKIVETDLPILVSTAGASLNDLDRVVTFLHNRGKDFAVMHCVAEYPTPLEELQLDRITKLVNRYPGVTIGYSTHEEPDETAPVMCAYAKGARIFERHVGVPGATSPLNAYSSTPQQVRSWISVIDCAILINGSEGETEVKSNDREAHTLRELGRFAFARTHLPTGHLVGLGDVFFAIPGEPGQLRAQDFSKYLTHRLRGEVNAGAPLTEANTEVFDANERVLQIVRAIRQLTEGWGHLYPRDLPLELSHHFGLEQFDRFGMASVTLINTEYCKKVLFLLPGQHHPEQFHVSKKETFYVQKGQLILDLDGDRRLLEVGSLATIRPGQRHAFFSETGAIIEEISTTHTSADSFYTDPHVLDSLQRKTVVPYWQEKILA